MSMQAGDFAYIGIGKVHLKRKCANEPKGSNIIPIVMNTGDMTQNGTRINEWFDYYNAGHVLFSKFEQMNVVGNNDLCGTNVTNLGTGDDLDKPLVPELPDEPLEPEITRNTRYTRGTC